MQCLACGNEFCLWQTAANWTTTLQSTFDLTTEPRQLLTCDYCGQQRVIQIGSPELVNA
jgi:aspartate carbamoyltransferase regulatory subunit